MAWSHQLSNRYFSNKSYQKGAAYYRGGAVRLIHGSDRTVEAVVQGTSRYHVFIDIVDNSFKVRCSCPWFDDTGSVCKHVWAALLAADAEGHLKAAEGLRNPAIQGVRQNSVFDIEGLPARTLPTKPPEWRQSLSLVHRATPTAGVPVRESVERQLCYLIDVARSWTAGNIIIRLVTRKRKKNGEWGKLPLFENNVNQIDSIADPQDNRILTMLSGAKEEYSYSPYSYRPDSVRSSHRIPTGLDVLLIPELCKTGRCFLLLASNELHHHVPAWDDGPPWEFGIEVRKEAAEDRYVLEGVLRRADKSVPVAQAVLATPSIVLLDNMFAALHSGSGYSWIPMLRQKGPITVNEAQKHDFAAELFNIGSVPGLKLPP